MAFAELPANLARVRDEIARVQSREGLQGPVRIVAVTKGHPAEAVGTALRAGLSDVGENRVQEALEKQDQAAGVPVTWHLIGHLQTNKAKHVPGRFGWVHSVDSVRVAEALARSVAARAAGSALKVLLQVNIAGEGQKSGCQPAEAPEIAERVRDLAGLELLGLMTMAPLTEDEGLQRQVFGDLRRLRDDLERQGHRLPELSMGMSGDFGAAVAEGATMLRLGTVLFGERPT
ncbi:MAG: YggS family pyridoxal phosphate-dependent enzyme [Gemmatimonadetes bacterium]|nr:YggS family pyridoxal phosphate-dependent enzyme [Gemmatimonadota bacterium]